MVGNFCAAEEINWAHLDIAGPAWAEKPKACPEISAGMKELCYINAQMSRGSALA